MAAPVFWRGNRTARVPMSMYGEHRGKLVAAMREACSASGAPLGVALLQGGAQQSRHDTDHEELFRQARDARLARALCALFTHSGRLVFLCAA